MKNGHRSEGWREVVGIWFIAGFPLALALTPTLALPADTPDSQPGPLPQDASLIPDVPEYSWIWEGPGVPSEMLYAPPFGPEDKGAGYTDAGVPGEAQALTEREAALLELSRAAVESSRLAGTLRVSPPSPTELEPPAAAREAAAKQKEAALHSPLMAAPTVATGAPADHMSASGSEQPRTGRVPMTPGEIEKLDTVTREAARPVEPAPADRKGK